MSTKTTAFCCCQPSLSRFRTDPDCLHPAFNPYVIPSFTACLERNQKLLLIFSEADRLRWEFESEFQEKCLKPDETFYQHNRVVVILEANHEFQFTPSKVLLQDAINDWLSSGKQSG